MSAGPTRCGAALTLAPSPMSRSDRSRLGGRVAAEAAAGAARSRRRDRGPRPAADSSPSLQRAAQRATLPGQSQRQAAHRGHESDLALPAARRQAGAELSRRLQSHPVQLARPPPACCASWLPPSLPRCPVFSTRGASHRSVPGRRRRGCHSARVGSRSLHQPAGRRSPLSRPASGGDTPDTLPGSCSAARHAGAARGH